MNPRGNKFRTKFSNRTHTLSVTRNRGVWGTQHRFEAMKAKRFSTLVEIQTCTSDKLSNPQAQEIPPPVTIKSLKLAIKLYLTSSQK